MIAEIHSVSYNFDNFPGNLSIDSSIATVSPNSAGFHAVYSAIFSILLFGGRR